MTSSRLPPTLPARFRFEPVDVRACAVYGTFFDVADPRQIHCSKRCQNRATYRRYKERRDD